MTHGSFATMAAILAPGDVPHSAPRAPTLPLPPRTPQFVPGMRAQYTAVPAMQAAQTARRAGASQRARRQAQAHSERVLNSGSAQVRRLLQSGQCLTAAEIARQLGMPGGGSINSKLRRDIQAGAVQFVDGRYRWATAEERTRHA